MSHQNNFFITAAAFYIYSVLCHFDLKQEDEVFTKTSCYHYFHSHCLGRYATHSELELRERERELEEDKSRDRDEEEVGLAVLNGLIYCSLRT